MKLNIVGIDPALSNLGLAKGIYDVDTGKFTPSKISLVSTSKQTGKTVRQNSDDLRRSQQLNSAVQEWITDAHVIFAEIPTGSQSARGSFSNGICLGILGAVGSVGLYKGRLIQVLPSEVKMAAVGSKNAAKYEMIEWATETYPDLDWNIYRGKFQNNNEHCADALAAIHAGFKTDEFRNLLTTLAIIK